MAERQLGFGGQSRVHVAAMLKKAESRQLAVDGADAIGLLGMRRVDGVAMPLYRGEQGEKS